MTPKPTEKELEEFARRTLKAMEASRDWGPDLWGNVAEEARRLGLAKETRDGYFKAVLPKAAK